MKIVHLVSFLILMNLSTGAQNLSGSTFSPKYLSGKEFKLQVTNAASERLKLPFSEIRVLDNRFDTGKIGFILSKNILRSEKTIFKKLTVKGGLARSLEAYYNKRYEKTFTPNGMGLLIVLKKFWVTSTYDFDHQAQSISWKVGSGTTVYSKWEYYIFKGDQLLPFKRLDTTVKTLIETTEFLNNLEISEPSSTRVNDLFNLLIERFQYDWPVSVFHNRKKMSYVELIHDNANRFLMPVLTDSARKNGVYLNFNEFKTNSPSIIDFYEKKMSYTTTRKEEYITTQTDSAITNYWGYTKNYETKVSKFGHDKLFRQGNTFEFFVKVRIANPRPMGYVILDNYTFYFVPYQLDMETGKFY